MAAISGRRGGSFAGWPASMRWNFIVLGADIAWFSLGLSISSAYTVLPLFVHSLTPNNVAVALIPAVRALGAFAPQLLVAPLVERRRRVLPLVLRLTVLERVPFLLLGLATLLLARGHTALLLAVFFLMILIATLGSGLCSPAWLDMIARAVPTGWLGRFLGLWTGVGGVMGIGGAALAALILAGVGWPLNFALCFMLTFVAMIVSFVLLSLGREPARPLASTAVPDRDGEPMTITPSAPLLPALREQTHALARLLRTDGGLRRLIASNAVAAVATMAGALFAVAALRGGGLSEAEVGAESTVLFIGSTAGYFLWGAVGDRFGHRAVLVWGALSAGVSALLALDARGFLAYGVVFVLLGLNLSAVSLAGMTFITEFGPLARRPTYIALASVAYAPFAVGAPVLGGWVADRWGYAPVFILAALAGLGAAALYQFAVPDPRRRAEPATR